MLLGQCAIRHAVILPCPCGGANGTTTEWPAARFLRHTYGPFVAHQRAEAHC